MECLASLHIQSGQNWIKLDICFSEAKVCCKMWLRTRLIVHEIKWIKKNFSSLFTFYVVSHCRRHVSHTSQTKWTTLVQGPHLVILVLSTSKNGVRKGLAHLGRPRSNWRINAAWNYDQICHLWIYFKCDSGGEFVRLLIPRTPKSDWF